MTLPSPLRIFTLGLCALLIFTNLRAGSPVNLLEIPVRDISGKELKIAELGAKAVLVVNVASECGYTSQYAGLESLYKTFKDKGLIVIGAPCNDFGAQEPGSDAEIQKFCSSQFHVTFPLLSKLHIAGENAHELFRRITSPEQGKPGPVTWNFNKFLISKEGRLVARFESSVEPDSEELKSAILRVLGQ